MRKITTLIVAGLLALTPLSVSAGDNSKTKEKDPNLATKAVEAVQNNPAKSASVVICGVAIAFFPPALLVCGSAAAGGTVVDEISKSAD